AGSGESAGDVRGGAAVLSGAGRVLHESVRRDGGAVPGGEHVHAVGARGRDVRAELRERRGLSGGSGVRLRSGAQGVQSAVPGVAGAAGVLGGGAAGGRVLGGGGAVDEGEPGRVPVRAGGGGDAGGGSGGGVHERRADLREELSGRIAGAGGRRAG